MSSEMRKHSFLQIPAEIRFMILRNVLHSNEILIEWEWLTLRVTSNASGGQILRTCKQLRDEGASILYSENIFSISAQDIDVFTNLFLSSIGPDNVSKLRHIKFNVDTLHYGFLLDPAIPPMMQLHPQLGNLRQVTWEILWEIMTQDRSCKSTCVWHGLAYSHQLPNFSEEIVFEGQPRKPTRCIMERRSC